MKNSNIDKNKVKLIQYSRLTDSKQDLKKMVHENNDTLDFLIEEKPLNNTDLLSNFIEQGKSTILDNTIINYIKKGKMDELHKFVEQNSGNFNLNSCDKKGWSLISIAIDSSKLDIDAKLKTVEKLIEYRVNVDMGTTTPLHLAAVSGYYEIAEALIKAGADVCAFDDDDKTPIDLAIEEKDKDMLKILGIKDEEIFELIDSSYDQSTSDLSVTPGNSTPDVWDVSDIHSGIQLNFDNENNGNGASIINKEQVTKIFQEFGFNKQEIMELLGSSDGESSSDNSDN